MKRKILAIALSLALATTCVLTLSTTANALTNTYEDTGSASGGTATQDKLATDPDANKTEIDVQAQVTGGSEIIYYVTIEWGAMKFAYNYGKTWNPSTHTYTGTGTGWNTSTYVDGTNNKIKVTNDSNFPVSANFSYENDPADIFNATPTSATAVKGVFNDNNTTLATEVTANTATTSTATRTMDLQMYSGALSNGEQYYYTGSSDTSGTQANSIGTMYFSLIGTPDPNLTTLATMQNVGKITVAIEAATGATQATKTP